MGYSVVDFPTSNDSRIDQQPTSVEGSTSSENDSLLGSRIGLPDAFNVASQELADQNQEFTPAREVGVALRLLGDLLNFSTEFSNRHNDNRQD